MFVAAIFIGAVTMGIIAFGPLMSVVLNHLALSVGLVGGIGICCAGAAAVGKLRRDASYREVREAETAVITGPGQWRLKPA